MKYLVFLFGLILIIGCGGPEPRRPVKVKSSKIFGGNLERNKKLLATEEKLIQAIIAKDSLRLYEESTSGSWFFYQKKNDSTSHKVSPDDLVTMTYNLMSLNNDTIYSHDDIGVITYKVDKQELFLGLREGVKLLKEKETATFLFPSSLAYGYQGDNDRIGINVPLKSTVTILKIEKDSILN